MTREIGLVSCVKTKQDTPAKPRDLYVSSYFAKMRAYAEQTHDEWWILSAKHGLLDPDGAPIDPYETTLTGAPIARKRTWADRVYGELEDAGLLEGHVTVVLHAGRDYYEELLPELERHDGVRVEIPTEGLTIGRTLSWYNSRLDE